MLGRARIIPVSVFLLAAFFSTLDAPPSHAASCPGVPAPSSDGNAFAGVVYDAVGGVMKTCVGSSWVSLGSGGGGGGASTLAGLTDVSTSGIADGKALVYNGTSSKWEPQTISGGGGSSTLATLTDVDTTGAADGKSLVYNATSSKWVPMTISGGGGGSGTVAGTTGKISKFVSSTEVGDSVVTESSGNIGIGVTPSYKLHVGNGQLVVDGSTASYSSIISGTGDTYIRGGAAGSKIVIGDQNTGTVEMTGPGNKIISGNVGIGTASPNARLDVGGATASTVQLGVTMDADDTVGLSIRRPTTATETAAALQLCNPGSGVGCTYVYQDISLGGLSIKVAGTYAAGALLHVTPAGNVGIGTTSPSALLHVAGKAIVGASDDQTPDSTSNGHLKILGAGYSGFATLDGSAMYLGHNSASRRLDLMTDETTRLSISGAGNVGIGTTNPTAKLHLSGTFKLGGQGAGAGDSYLCWNSSTASVTYNTSACNPSDIRLKKNIETLEDPLNKLASLRGVRFEWIDEHRPRGEQIGLIAQEVEKVFPSVVSVGDDGYMSVSYDKLVAPLVEAVKQLKADNDSLRAELKAANENFEDLRREVDALKVVR